MRLSDFDYKLPEDLIAHLPSNNRDESNMMVLNRQSRTVGHKKFFDIVDLLDENDLLVLNNTKVIPARLIGKKSTGARIEIFLLEQENENTWQALIKPAKRVKEGTVVEFSGELNAKILKKAENDKWLVEFSYDGSFSEILNKIGNIPLPPYIERNLSDNDLKKIDYERYQTVYAQNSGSVAAPTAGLHFTDTILTKLKNKGTEICYVTLNVGLGTFRPVKTENILDHRMDFEQFEITEDTANKINSAKHTGKNIVAVGTTTVRTLETCAKRHGKIIPAKEKSDLFIYPGYEFQVIDKLITNFHLPKSTLLMLVSALAGKDFIFKAYQEAIEKKYRFYSYGDCMFIN